MPDQQETRSPENTDMLGMWTELVSKLMNAGASLSPDTSPPDAFRQIRSATLDAWANFWQRLLRSPEFLQLLKQMMDVNLQMRRQASDFWGQMQHEFQGTSRQDFDQLMRALRHLEHRLADATERISRSLDDLNDRLDAFEQEDPAGEGSTEEGVRRAHRLKRRQRHGAG